MFKLIKILNSCSNVPEPLVIETNGENIPEGALIRMSAGVASNCPQDEKPQYVSLAKGGDSYVIAYPITHDMVFEAEFLGDPYEIYEGDTVGIGIDNSGNATGVYEMGSIFYLMSRNGAEKYGDKVIVRPVV